MSIYKGSKLVAGSNTNTVSDIIKLFKHDWYDYSFSDLSWVRADDFEWIYADRYPIAYEHLYADFISTSTWQSETIGSYTIQFKIAPDGHRITDHANEGIVQNIYGQSGVAWYYIIDTVNERFKLPRTKHSITGLRDEVGKYVEAGAPNITGNMYFDYGTTGASGPYSVSGSFIGSNTINGRPNSYDSNSATGTVSFNASRSSSVYGKSTTIQPPATQQYLYFYLGQFPVSALVNPDIAETKANTSMNNLNSVGRNIANWSSNVTNCITEIPQDIKLELNNGTLTLKAGSKYYVPNGVGHFDVVVTSRDITIQGWSNLKGVVIMQSDGNGSAFTSLGQCYSGTSQPILSGGNVWYDTSSNMVKRCNDSQTFVGPYSLPICIVTSSGSSQQVSTIASVDQVFNGFGYIGSTVFALPGVKGLIPNGWNKDGSLRNIEFTTSSVLTYTNPSNVSYSGSFIITNDLSLQASDQKYWKYNQQENLFKHESSFYLICEFSFFECNLGKITSFTPKTAFHALDYNDKEEVVNWSMPDYSAGIAISGITNVNKQINIPTDGFLQIKYYLQNGGEYFYLNDDIIFSAFSYNTTNTYFISAPIPITKGNYNMRTLAVAARINSVIFYPKKGLTNA